MERWGEGPELLISLVTAVVARHRPV